MKKCIVYLFVIFPMFVCNSSCSSDKSHNGDGEIHVNLVFRQGSVSSAVKKSVAITEANSVSASYSKFGTKLGSFTSTKFKMLINTLQLLGKNASVEFSPSWSWDYPGDDMITQHYADFTNPYAPALSNKNTVIPGDYDWFVFFVENGESTLTIGSGYTVSTDSSIIVDSKEFKNLQKLYPAYYDTSLKKPNNNCTFLIYGPCENGIVSSESSLTDLTSNQFLSIETIQGAILISKPNPIHIPENASTLTIEFVWDLTNIIEKYADDGPVPVNGGQPFYVLADGYWNKMKINVVVE